MKVALKAGAVVGAVFLFAAGAAVGFMAHGRRAVHDGFRTAPGAAPPSQAQQARTMAKVNIGLKRTGRDDGGETGDGGEGGR